LPIWAGFQIILDRVDEFAGIRSAVGVRKRQPFAESADAAPVAARH
jgi:hypothetical protein